MGRAVAGAIAAASFVLAGVADSAPPTEGARYLVKFRDRDAAAAAAEVAAAGGRVALELGPQRVVAAYLPEQALQGLRHNPNVEYVEEDALRHPMAQTKPYGITMVQADDASFSGSEASAASAVCIIDSGYHRAHEDLQDTNVTGTNDPGTGNWFEDSCGHGSHVAGTISALNNTVGVIGVNSNGQLRLDIEKVFNGSSCAWSYSSTLVEALNRCQAAVAGTGKKLVVNMSLGGGVPTTTEQDAFQAAYDAGVLPIAAAGNGGNTAISYPAGYPSVVSVAAVDSTMTVASFSQQNADVELAAPGVGVLSTTPFEPSSLTAGGNTWPGSNIEGSARTNASGALANGGLCDSVGAWSGKVVLCQRGNITFAQKVANVVAGGGTGAAIYNNVSGGFLGTLNGSSTIPAISLSMEDGQAALAFVNQASTLVNTLGNGNGYEYYNGTSMATPHVAGVAALVWSYFPTKTNAEIRDALQKSALDLGAAGRDDAYGYGLVRAKAAYDYLAASGTVGLASLTLKNSTIAGCKSVAATVTLTAPAPATGVVVTLGDGLANATTPATLTIPAGVASKNFTVKSTAVAASQSGPVNATLGATTLSQTLTLRPIGPLAPVLVPNPVIGGNSVAGTGKLECNAGPGPITVNLSSTNATLASPSPASLVFPVGVKTLPFTVTTTPVAVRTKATIKATANGITKSKVLTVDP